MSSFMPLGEAASRLGFGSGPALRKCFERNLVPGKYLVRIGTRVLRVDVVGLEEWLRNQQAYPSIAVQKEAGHAE
jgi:hypothetical protein